MKYAISFESGQLITNLQQISNKLSNLKPALTEIQQSFYQQTEEMFNTAPWQPLSPKYQQWKNKHYPAKPILQRTETLKNALTGKNSAKIEQFDNNNTLYLGTNLPYADLLHSGTKKMPPRPLINNNEEIYLRNLRTFLLEGVI